LALELLLGMGLFSPFLFDLNSEVLLDDDEDDNPDPGGYGICDGNATKLKIAAKTCSSTGIWSGVRMEVQGNNDLVPGVFTGLLVLFFRGALSGLEKGRRARAGHRRLVEFWR
jgi:hypothetical protein